MFEPSLLRGELFVLDDRLREKLSFLGEDAKFGGSSGLVERSQVLCWFGGG